MKRIFIILLALTGTYSCTQDLENLNRNTKDATEANGGSFFAYSVKEMADILQNITYGGSGNPFSICRHFAQHISCNTYNEGTNYFAQFNWSSLYSSVLINLEESRKIIDMYQPIDEATAQEKQNRLALIEIMNIYAYARLVESFGDIPYTEALNIDNVQPRYDDGETVYVDLINRLNTAIGNLTPTVGAFGTFDLLYGDNVALWLKFANSLKLQMGLRVIDALPELGAEAVQSTVSSVFSSNADNAEFQYLETTPNTNPLWSSLAVGNRQDFVAAEPLVDEMNRLNDPRRAVYFSDVSGDFIGAPYGQPVEYNRYSHFGALFYTPAVPAIFLDYATVEFLLAEAVERGLTGAPADAETHYNAAIRASFEYYGVALGDYLEQPAVAYQTAEGSWKQKIGMQKWIALFNQGYEAWTEYRRLDYPLLVAPPGAFVDVVPRRLLYPVSEQTLNEASWSAAATAIGGDLMTTKLFWDIY
ncbi:SusD/RagB family nutrient-binding outer membrane lipoprotein [Parapedobacter koreensis]|uniref:Starch-binding associating with outer membrane n=1 Tax=Parapedobacter koreensis TaxID=332977 RepID=A0A1H7GDG8_9SPHI|nr:SusD/RagB family nutrient-binding outer membrane lipoprotein [Parapedobacter koreensis]SEK34530.1 Starch-binding associating with outer membrane [Parapedobacter koreensis]